jgi:phosphoglycolate phosphatase
MSQLKAGPFRAVIFDLDGTLLDTLEDISFSLNTVLERHGYPTHSLDECRMLVGFGMQALVKTALPEHSRDESLIGPLLEEMKAVYAGHWNVHSRPYEGIGRMLEAIDAMGLRKAILSNKPDRFTKLCADELLAPWHFEVVMGHHDGIAHKPDPEGALVVAGMLDVEPSEILYVGDSGIDMKTANAAGMYPFGVLWGFRPEEELRATGAASLAASPQDIVEFLELSLPE